MTTTTGLQCPRCQSPEVRHIDADRHQCSGCGKLLRLVYGGKLVPWPDWERAGIPKARR